MKKIILLSLALAFLLGCNNTENGTKVNLRLKWLKQAQFAGYLVAEAKGFYKEQGIKVEILPAGPDVKSFITVANGSDQFGVAMPNQIIMARSNGVPLTIIGQIMQDSPYRYILKSENKIDSLSEIKGDKIGLWLKADEAEFIAMLKKEGLSLNDFDVIPQEYSVVPFLEDKYVLSAVTVYNELNQIRRQGYEGDKLQVLSPKDYNCAFLGDMLFTNEKYLKENPETVKKFLIASIKGWKYTIQNQDEALNIVLQSNPELDREQQKEQLKAVIELIETGKTLSEGIGFMDPDEYKNIQRILIQSGQISKEIDISKVYTNEIWNKIRTEEKILQK